MIEPASPALQEVCSPGDDVRLCLAPWQSTTADMLEVVRLRSLLHYHRIDIPALAVMAVAFPSVDRLSIRLWN